MSRHIYDYLRYNPNPNPYPNPDPIANPNPTPNLNRTTSGYPGGVLRMQYHSTAAVPDFFFAPSEWMNVIG
jgi:hypothetical protein